MKDKTDNPLIFALCRIVHADHIIDLQRHIFHDADRYTVPNDTGSVIIKKSVSQQNLSYEQYYLYSYSETKTLTICTVVTR